MAKKETVTPMMRQYLELKEEHPDCLLFFRLGDFYELFFDDAITASKELDIVLTGRDCGLEERAPMCGVPFHSVDGYLNKLIEKGYRIAICEQLTDPKEGKGIVERGIVRIVSPGTVTEETMLEEQKNNYIVCVIQAEDGLGVAYADVTTGEFHLGEIAPDEIMDFLAQLDPAELVSDHATIDLGLFKQEGQKDMLITEYPDWAFAEVTARKNLLTHFQVASLDGFGCSQKTKGIRAAGALLNYLNETQKNALAHINHIAVYQRDQSMIIDHATRRNLELIQPMNSENKKATLLGLLNKTCTGMGGRMLRKWIEQPLCTEIDIQQRQDVVEELFYNPMLCDTIYDIFSGVYDLERICGRIAYGTVNARDALAIKKSLILLPNIKEALKDTKSAGLQRAYESFDPMDDICSILDEAICVDPPLSVKEGGIIREGFNEAIDRLRSASDKAKEWLEDLEKREREATGIKNLKIRYNKVFGYYIEVTKSYLSQVPYRYQRKQTLANAERYITQELKELEDQVLGSQEKSVVLEYTVFCEIRQLLNKQIPRIQALANWIAQIDAWRSLAFVARDNQYVKPTIHSGNELFIQDGRHPVVEKMQKGQFVANDTHINTEDERLLIITGPNMAGKSTYMRQVALIALMAHIGSFVPATSAKIPVLDRIFTRVGASDDLASGQSTFMMEMSETANILRNATANSLLIMDEIGRGTSTFDGLSIAWAVCEYIADTATCGAKTLFATHYHELSELEGRLDGVVNYRITAKEMGENVVFLRKIVRGGTDKSFGIHVAKLAGVPTSVIERAKVILQQLEASDLARTTLAEGNIVVDIPPIVEVKNNDLGAEIMQAVRDIDINTLTPLQALIEINRLHEMSKSTE